jgi:hypothetical protein
MIGLPIYATAGLLFSGHNATELPVRAQDDILELMLCQRNREQVIIIPVVIIDGQFEGEFVICRLRPP